MYLSAPLQTTGRTSAFQHIIEAGRAASLIEGAQFDGKRVTTFIPHIAVLSLFDEFEVAARREAAMGFNIFCLEQCHALIKVGTRISAGMQAEIIAAERLELPVMSLSAFTQQLTALPSLSETQETFISIVKSLPSEFFAEKLTQRRSKRESKE